MKRVVYRVMNDPYFSPRSEIFFNTLKRMRFLEIRECSSVLEIKENKDERCLVFFEVVACHGLHGLPRFLKENPYFSDKMVLMCLDDVPPHKEWVHVEVPILNMNGALRRKGTIAGYGFIPHIRKSEFPDFSSDVRFEERNDKFCFAGAIRVDRRYNWLIDFMKKAEVEYAIQEDIPVPKVLKPFIRPRLGWKDYFNSMESHKFSLSPLGHGHTFRVLESMAAGALVVVDDISHLKFNKRYFVEGENYLATGRRMEKIDEVLKICRDTERAKRIALNGRETYQRHFHLRDDLSLSLSSITDILFELNNEFDSFFDLSSYLL